MSFDDIERENKTKKKRCQSLLTFQTHDPSHQTESTIHRKIMKPDPQEKKTLNDEIKYINKLH
jgi:hypothetical protein